MTKQQAERIYDIVLEWANRREKAVKLILKEVRNDSNQNRKG